MSQSQAEPTEESKREERARDLTDEFLKVLDEWEDKFRLSNMTCDELRRMVTLHFLKVSLTVEGFDKAFAQAIEVNREDLSH